MGFSKFNQRVFLSFVFSLLPPSHDGMASIIARRILWGNEGKLIALQRRAGKFSRHIVFPSSPGRPGCKGHTTHSVRWSKAWAELYGHVNLHVHTCTAPPGDPGWAFWPRIQPGLLAPYRVEHLDPIVGGLSCLDPCLPKGTVDQALDPRPGDRDSRAVLPVTHCVAPSNDSAPLGFPLPTFPWLLASTDFLMRTWWPRVRSCNVLCASESEADGATRRCWISLRATLVSSKHPPPPQERG